MADGTARHGTPEFSRISWNYKEIVNASAGPADPGFEGRNGCRRSILGQHRKSLEMKSREFPKSSQMRPGRLQNRFQDLSGVTPGPLPGALGGKSAFRPIFRCLLAAPGPLPGRSWGCPGPLLTPPGSLLGSLGALRGWFCELLALLLQTPSENRGNLVFCRQTDRQFNTF